MLHSYHLPTEGIPLPEKFTCPFCYIPHQLSVMAVQQVRHYLREHTEWHMELGEGKMFGVLVVLTAEGELGFLAAFSGMLAGKSHHSYFVPPVYDLMQPDGFFQIEEEQICAINARIEELQKNPQFNEKQRQLGDLRTQAKEDIAAAKAAINQAKKDRKIRRMAGDLDEAEEAAMIRESQFQNAELKRKRRLWESRVTALREELVSFDREIEALKAERKSRSAALQTRVFQQFKLLNARGEIRDLSDIFADTPQGAPPAGAGECAAPKLLQYAYAHQLKPVAMAEFWWGKSPKAEIRHHGCYYPACQAKCGPILKHMLQGLEVEENLLNNPLTTDLMPERVYEDRWMMVVNKPAGMLSVPGRGIDGSVYSLARLYYPDATGPLLVHRLDMDTSGLLLVAKTKEAHLKLQAQFENRTIHKRYIALLDGTPPAEEGVISLPIGEEEDDSFRRKVDYEKGKPATTLYRVLEHLPSGMTRVAFSPLTGRTHQLRVHAAHPDGLGCPIHGDPLYGQRAERLYLHAESLDFRHPATDQEMHITCEAPF